MNFLAHIYLSGTNELLTLGNFVADGIKGKQYLEFPDEMQAGIILHRKIDSFTDSHPVFRQSTKRLHKNYSHYSGVIIDIYYDHFLAKHWDNYSNISLKTFSSDFYKTVENNFELMPPKFQHLSPAMIAGNWLESYASTEGINKVLGGMDRRTKMQSKMSFAVEDLKQNYSEFQNEFFVFFEELKSYSNQQLKSLEHKYNI